MSTIQDIIYKQKMEKLEPKLRELIKRIGRVDSSLQMRLVTINHNFLNGKQIAEKDIDFIMRLHV